MEFHLGVLLIAMGRIEEARSYFMASTLRFQTVGDRHGQAQALNRWAYLDRLQQQSGSALSLAERALSLVTTEDPEAFYGQFVLGCLAIDRHDWSQALILLSQALAGWRSYGDPVMVARGLTNLGTALRGAGQPDQAIDHYLHAIDMMVSLGDTSNEAVTRMNLGNVYLDQGQLELAMAQYHQAEQVFRKTEDYLRLSRVNLNMGLVHKRNGQWQLAHSTLGAAIDIFRLLGDHRATANAMDALAEVHLMQGQFSAALAVLEQALTEVNGLEGHPGYAPLLTDIDQHLAEARRGIGL
jgi:tetratricopeptide (TPR) repeat protein